MCQTFFYLKSRLISRLTWNQGEIHDLPLTQGCFQIKPESHFSNYWGSHQLELVEMHRQSQIKFILHSANLFFQWLISRLLQFFRFLCHLAWRECSGVMLVKFGFSRFTEDSCGNTIAHSECTSLSRCIQDIKPRLRGLHVVDASLRSEV